MKKIMDRFWQWYNKHYTLNITVSTGLFVIQIVHLYWLTTHVVLYRLTNISFWDPNILLQTLLIFADYTEIPALISVSLIYINSLRQHFKVKSLLFVLMLYSQFLHIFWITDEFVVEHFIQATHETILPFWLAWVAIVIDYLELPVIFDTTIKLLKAIFTKRLHKLKDIFEEK